MNKFCKYCLPLFLLFIVFNSEIYGGTLLHKQNPFQNYKKSIKPSGQITKKNIQKKSEIPITINYLWLKNNGVYKMIADIAPPQGYKRIPVKKGSFAEFLRYLPLKKDKIVYLFNGEQKVDQSFQYEVIDLDIGSKDIQQCADTIMRLRAEYLFSKGETAAISFHFVNGFKCEYSKWKNGYGIKIKGNSVKWVKTAENNGSYESFRKYLNIIFNYANTVSFSKELKTVNDRNIQMGDIIIHPGFPGHAVLIVDIVKDHNGQKKFLLLQGFMPTQNAYILKTMNYKTPWYKANFEETFETPEYIFRTYKIMRFFPI